MPEPGAHCCDTMGSSNTMRCLAGLLSTCPGTYTIKIALRSTAQTTAMRIYRASVPFDPKRSNKGKEGMFFLLRNLPTFYG